MCCKPITSLNLSGPTLLSSPLKFGVWYKWSLKSPYLWTNSCSILLEFGLPRDPRRWSSNMVHLIAGFEIPESASSNRFTWQRKSKQIKIHEIFLPTCVATRDSPLYKHLQLGSMFLIGENCAWSFRSNILDHLIDCTWFKGQTSSHVVTDPLIFCSLEDIYRLITLWAWLQMLLKGTYKCCNQSVCVLNWQYTSSVSLDPVPKYSDDHTTLLSAVCMPRCKDDIIIKTETKFAKTNYLCIYYLESFKVLSWCVDYFNILPRKQERSGVAAQPGKLGQGSQFTEHLIAY